MIQSKPIFYKLKKSKEWSNIAHKGLNISPIENFQKTIESKDPKVFLFENEFLLPDHSKLKNHLFLIRTLNTTTIKFLPLLLKSEIPYILVNEKNLNQKLLLKKINKKLISIRKKILSNNSLKLKLNELKSKEDNLSSVLNELTIKKETLNQKKYSDEKNSREILLFIRSLNSAFTLNEFMYCIHRHFTKNSNLKKCGIIRLIDEETGIFYFNNQDKKIIPLDPYWKKIKTIHINDSEAKKQIEVFTQKMNNDLVHVIPLASNKKNYSWLILQTSENYNDLITEIIYTLPILINIKEKIILDYELQFTQKIWQQAFNSLNMPIAIIDKDKKIYLSNNAFKKEITHDFDLDSINTNFEISLKNNVYRVHKKLFNLKFSFTILVLENLTQERQMFIQSIQTEKIKLLAELSSHINHELLNPIGGILSLCELIEKDSTWSEETQKDIGEISKAAKKAIKIIHNLTEFTQTSKPKISPYNIKKLINESLIYSKSIQRKIKLEFICEDDLIYAQVNPDLFQQAIFNLIKNAAQAIKDKGKITIKLYSIEKNYLRIEVQDTGPGIPNDFLHKIFEPLFSTKEIGEGTGLGLSLVKAMIESWNGKIWAESKLNEGATFIIELPKIINNDKLT